MEHVQVTERQRGWSIVCHMRDMTKPMTRGAMADGEREENSETAGGRENP